MSSYESSINKKLLIIIMFLITILNLLNLIIIIELSIVIGNSNTLKGISLAISNNVKYAKYSSTINVISKMISNVHGQLLTNRFDLLGKEYTPNDYIADVLTLTTDNIITKANYDLFHSDQIFQIMNILGLSEDPDESVNETYAVGKFTLENNHPNIDQIVLYEANEQTQLDSGSSLTVQTEYALKITVSDSNALNDITEITVIIYRYTVDPNTYPGQDSPQYRATFKWTPSDGWILVGPTSSTWKIYVDPDKSRAPSDMSATSGDWWLHFAFGKVATWDNSGTYFWGFYVEVKDSIESISSRIYGYKINWYGEIAINADDQNFSFGSVSLGTYNNPLTSPASYIRVYVVANGNYKIQVKASDSTGTNDYWIGQTYGDQAKIVTTTPGDGEIRLKVDDDGIAGNGNEIIINPQSQGYNDWTTESGPTSDGNSSNGNGTEHKAYLYLDIGSSGLLPDTYTGVIWFSVNPP